MGEIVMFGITGGLIPCPALNTILLICLLLKQFTLGTALVLCFGIGVALTMVSVGAAAALSVKDVSKRWSGFAKWRIVRPRALFIIAVGLDTGYLGWAQLAASPVMMQKREPPIAAAVTISGAVSN